MIANIDMLEEEMKMQNLSINGLAEKSGIDKSTISRLLDGRSCSVSTAQKLVNALNIEPKKAGQIFFGN